MNEIILSINDFIWGYILIVLLIAAGIFFTLRSKFVQFRNIPLMFKLLGEGVANTHSKKRSVSSFQAFCISTASRVGVGNLAGVASAIAIGGAGAIFWMWLIALIGSASGFIEATLAQIFKLKSKDSFIGGPAYYMEQGLGKRWFGVLFAVLITITFGLTFNSVQANTITLAFEEAFGFDRVVMGVIITILSLAVIFGGVHRIAIISSILVPVMAILYILLAVVIIGMNIGKLPDIISLIVGQAMGFEQFAGGALGATIMQGIKRGLFSNEAGMGSAPNAAATADVKHPVEQGLIQTLGVFTDTIIICSCTAFIILLADVPLDGSVQGIELTQKAITSHISSTGGVFIAIAILLFAFSSIISNYYYGETNIRFIKDKPLYITLYRFMVGAMVMFGATSSLSIVWNLADLFMALMTITNIIAIVLLSKYAFSALADYQQQRRSGIKSPIFRASSIKDLSDKLSLWK